MYRFTSNNSTIDPGWFFLKCKSFLEGDPDPYFFDFVDIQVI